MHLLDFELVTRGLVVGEGDRVGKLTPSTTSHIGPTYHSQGCMKQRDVEGHGRFGPKFAEGKWGRIQPKRGIVR